LFYAILAKRALYHDAKRANVSGTFTEFIRKRYIDPEPALAWHFRVYLQEVDDFACLGDTTRKREHDGRKT
jgi:hypothetical protein